MKPYRKAPPLQYLPAFVKSAQLRSFKHAAMQLNITPSAISQQIKALEENIGLSLFKRSQRELQLTQAGASFYETAARALSAYESGWEEFCGQYISATIHLSMISYVANEIVIPRLAEFRQAYPQIDLINHTSMATENLQDKTLDAAIRFGTPPWAGHDAQLICPAYAVPVASSEYVQQNKEKDKNWQQHSLIHGRNGFDDWQAFGGVSGKPADSNPPLYFDSYDASLCAARAGLGVALAILPISAHELRSGRLQALTDQPLECRAGFYFVSKPNDHKWKDYERVSRWLCGVFAAL